MSLLPSLSILLKATELSCINDNTINTLQSNKIQLPPLNRDLFHSPIDPIQRIPSIPPLIVKNKTDVKCHNSNQKTFTSIETLTPAATPVPLKRSHSDVSSEDVSAARNSIAKNIDIIAPSPIRKGEPLPNSKKVFAFVTHSPDSYPKNEPKVDDEQLVRRKRRRTSSQESDILHAHFSVSPILDKETRSKLSKLCSMSEKAVQIWFQNKRQALKRQALAKQEEEAAAAAAAAAITLPDSSSLTQSSLQNNNQPVKGPQALTFHINGGKGTLKAIKTSPNNRVNRLINNYRNGLGKEQNGAPFKNHNGKTLKLAFDSTSKISLR
ncbi:hypothetical protein Kpol_1023p80 [Vanderwaltozyma polyspora DSM 70294]|uniref:Homeobox domain-containing protein n=1 Tax=Vanderwaltozyma polyspora (strain ATCC 22028 / DSM 70294 / BCRC 21397 / CBS 2163 / NBRC 10782 / NRRL Y-8283 / UCD 57-17) TaxID=436907 RepID=A7TFV1_VANPO|nr:uncharacterized protein Kpol_1023p80 [Vanderwaltozyma polyspora DSM 70294]EDO18909.1 hypothetical protein Kpol_1023p80 [Vanderwaltozyma polyspora DSM 70294]